jgi:hypothetical protein
LKSTRTIAALVAVLAALVAIVLWWLTSKAIPAVHLATADTSSPATESLPLDAKVDEERHAPEATDPVLLEADRRAEARGSLEKPMWAKVTVVVVDPTNSVADDRERSMASLFPQFGSGITTLAKQGVYEYSVHPGNARFLLHQRGFKPVQREFEVRGDEPVQREEVVLEPTWTLTVHLRSPDGGGVAEQIRRLVGWPGAKSDDSPVSLWPLAVVASVDPPGQTTAVQHLMHNEWIADVSTDDLKLDVVDDPPVHVSVLMARQVLATQRLDTRVEEITLTINLVTARAQLSGLAFQVVDSLTAGPIDGVKASLVDAGVVRTEKLPDAEGRVQFSLQTPGTYTLELDWENRFMTSRTVHLTAGETIDLGTIALTAGVEISGSFSDVEGKPDRVWYAQILADDADSGATGARRLVQVALDRRFSVRDLAAGRYVLSAIVYEKGDGGRLGRVLGISGPILIDTRAGPARNLAIELHPAVRLDLIPRIAGFENYRCTIRSADGRLESDGRLGPKMHGVDFIAPGSYVLTVTKLGELVSRTPFEARSKSVTIEVP